MFTCINTINIATTVIMIRNRKMSDIMFEWVTQNIMNGRGVNRLDDVNRPKSPEIKNDIRLFRQELRDAAYHFRAMPTTISFP